MHDPVLFKFAVDVGNSRFRSGRFARAAEVYAFDRDLWQQRTIVVVEFRDRGWCDELSGFIGR